MSSPVMEHVSASQKKDDANAGRGQIDKRPQTQVYDLCLTSLNPGLDQTGTLPMSSLSIEIWMA